MKTRSVVQKVVVGAVIINNEGKILILQRSSDEDVFPNLWELPSGKKEQLENCQDALVREVFEETGLRVEPTTPVLVFNYQIQKNDETRDTTEIDFMAKLIGEPLVRLSSEHQAYVWIGETEIDKYKVSQPIKQAIKSAQSFRKK